MKKLRIFIFIISSLLLLSSCSLLHKHEFGEWQTESAPDCTSEGVDARYCKCGEKETRAVAALGHTEKVITGYASSCSKTGLTDGKYCTVCLVKTVEQETIAKAPHTEVIDYGRPATCANEGLTDGKHCDTCGSVTVVRQPIPKLPHNEVYVQGTPATCTSNGYTDGTFCADCGEIILRKTVIPKLPHNEVEDAEIPATCYSEGKTLGKHCVDCGLVTVEQTVVAKKPHTAAIDFGIPATCTTDGLTDGLHCSVCNKVTLPQLTVLKLSHADVAPTCTKWGVTYEGNCKHCNLYIAEKKFLQPSGHNFSNGLCLYCGIFRPDFSDITLYAPKNIDDMFTIYKNGKKMKAFYDYLLEGVTEFHNSTTAAAKYDSKHTFPGTNWYYIKDFNFSTFGLNFKEARTVFYILRNNNPVFYWLANGCIASNNSISILTEKEFASPSSRMKYNKMLYEGIEKYVSLADGETSAYNIALVYYEAIIKNNSYGKEDYSIFMHSVIGAFAKNSFVCEGYAKLFQLLLNYSNIENQYVLGDSDGYHAWNIVRMDDGEWYWFDPTFDEDDPITFDYFCNDDEFLLNHTPDKTGVLNEQATHVLPKMSTSAFDADNILELGEEFAVGNSVYKRSSANGVKYVRGTKIKESKIVYNGVVYVNEG